MYYIFNRTTGMAQSYLFPRYKEDSVNPFLSWQEMISFLADQFSNPYKAREAAHEYYKLMIKLSQTYVKF